MPNRIKLESNDLITLLEIIDERAYDSHDIEIETMEDLQNYLVNYKNEFVFTDIGGMLNVNYFGD
jgi:hypothetical protein